MRTSKAPLFQRVESERIQHYSLKDWQEEIGRSLSYLFNTHQGSALAVQDYGLPVLEPEELTLRKLKAYENEMRLLIQTYEPRFKKVEVRGQFDEAHKSRVIFHITGQMDESLSGGRVSYRSVMMENGQMVMRM